MAGAAESGGEIGEVLEAVGPRLQALRRSRALTLAQLSELTGISVSTLSRLESGQRRPTLELLLPLARAYSVPLDELVGAPQTGDPRIHATPIVRHGITMLPLSRQPGGVRAYKQIFPPHWPDGWPAGRQEPEQQSHEGHEWLYVLSGRLRLRLGEHDLILKPGEAAEFSTLLPHFTSNPTDQPTEVLALFGPQGERMHVRARSR